MTTPQVWVMALPVRLPPRTGTYLESDLKNHSQASASASSFSASALLARGTAQQGDASITPGYLAPCVLTITDAKGQLDRTGKTVAQTIAGLRREPDATHRALDLPDIAAQEQEDNGARDLGQRAVATLAPRVDRALAARKAARDNPAGTPSAEAPPKPESDGVPGQAVGGSPLAAKGERPTAPRAEARVDATGRVESGQSEPQGETRAERPKGDGDTKSRFTSFRPPSLDIERINLAEGEPRKEYHSPIPSDYPTIYPTEPTLVAANGVPTLIRDAGDWLAAKIKSGITAPIERWNNFITGLGFIENRDVAAQFAKIAATDPARARKIARDLELRRDIQRFGLVSCVPLAPMTAPTPSLGGTFKITPGAGGVVLTPSLTPVVVEAAADATAVAVPTAMAMSGKPGSGSDQNPETKQTRPTEESGRASASDSSKNERHGDAGRALTKADKQIEKLKKDLEAGIIVCIGADDHFFYKGRNLIGLSLSNAVKVIGENYDSSESQEVLEDEQIIYRFDSLSLDIWTEDNKVVTVQCSERVID